MACIPRVGILIGYHAFDLSILYSRREVNNFFLLILTILFRPEVGILIIFFRKCQNPHPMPDPPPPPLGLDIDRCIIRVTIKGNWFELGVKFITRIQRIGIRIIKSKGNDY